MSDATLADALEQARKFALVTDALQAAYDSPGVGWQGAFEDTVVEWPAFIAALAAQGVYIVTEDTILAAFYEVGGTNQGDIAHARFIFEAIAESSAPTSAPSSDEPASQEP